MRWCPVRAGRRAFLGEHAPPPAVSVRPDTGLVAVPCPDGTVAGRGGEGPTGAAHRDGGGDDAGVGDGENPVDLGAQPVLVCRRVG
ncbi:MAG TPA: hypothetical protein VIW24_17720 [Aldersonia sp.]